MNDRSMPKLVRLKRRYDSLLNEEVWSAKFRVFKLDVDFKFKVTTPVEDRKTKQPVDEAEAIRRLRHKAAEAVTLLDQDLSSWRIPLSGPGDKPRADA